MSPAQGRGVRLIALAHPTPHGFFMLTAACAANVDEVFIDLCRQMLRRDDIHDDSRADDVYYHKSDDPSSSKRRRRRKGRDKEHKCVVL